MEQLVKLKTWLQEAGSIALAFSGGIDSTLLGVYAAQVLGPDQVLLVIGDSPLHKAREARGAVQVAKDYGIPYQVVSLDELSHPAIAHNQPDSWYYSKYMLYQAVIERGKAANKRIMVDGMILDDLKDYRPGLRARDDLGIVSPLILAGFDKAQVRQAAREIGIHTWNQIPACSLISRFPYNSPISPQALRQVEAVETLLEAAGFVNPRARYYKSMVKIELRDDQVDDYWQDRETFTRKINALGFKQVALDTEGYQTGIMNQDLDLGG